MFKNINWKNVGVNAIKVLIIFILNISLWVYLIGKMVPYANLNNGEFKLSWIDYLELSKQVPWYAKWLLYIGIAIGIILSVLFIKWWITATKKEKDKQELMNANKENVEAIINAINNNKEKEKENKAIEKYIGE